MIGFYLQKDIDNAVRNAVKGGFEYVSIASVIYEIFSDKNFRNFFENEFSNFEYENFKTSIGELIASMPKSDEKNRTKVAATTDLARIMGLFEESIDNENELDFISYVLASKDTDAAKIFEFYGINSYDFDKFRDRYLQWFDNRDMAQNGENGEMDEGLFNDFLGEDDESKKKKKPASELYTTNLNEMAKSGKIDPLIGREKEIEKTLQTLCRRKKNNPVLVGEAGVGKTAIIEGIALKIANGEVPAKLADKTIYALDMGALVAGTTLRGEFEERLKNVIDEFSKNDKAILFIDEIHTIAGAGAGSREDLDMSNLLKPGLANGTLSLIGATTYAEFRNLSKDKALARRLCKIDINEPSIEDSVEILKGIVKKYEEFHNVKFSDEILREAVNLAKRYESDKFLPDSAIDLIDEVGASYAFKEHSEAINVSKEDLVNVLSASANIANLSQSVDNKETLRNLEENIKKEIFGQGEAVSSLSKALLRSYAGLRHENSPIGVFLFTGSSGVGKSELAKVLAKNLGVNFERFDMSEYMEAHSVSRLIGAPPGYVGFENGGILTNQIKKHPYSVVLFDEIEKAHPSMTNIFLGIFDNGVLTDTNGTSSDFKNTIIIMTSNLGTKEAPQVGFTKDESYKIDNAVKSFFAPEFRNRIDKIINFNPLKGEILEKIVDKTVREIQSGLKNIEISLSKGAKEYLIKKGYSAEFGARNLKREVQLQISDEISSEILFGALQNGGRVFVDFADEKLKFDFESVPMLDAKVSNTAQIGEDKNGGLTKNPDEPQNATLIK
ncbi:AAA family ATPase [Campylobacter sp. VBCF_05 NA6]|uniref:AAA family ATPase n=1 Tax=unclassified Campylobacter TaxID=2593542 RepID=UPI0022E9FCAB|nr:MULTISPECIES: AAA family ATPase [unclassified Campylobacter]MDA3054021.1 AAA family ATPase [Campylobacter sp. VBCF_07 NA4]MDA3057687.1 AAA family ATPase [Campylobacter sp. VBCF_04 NA7]MDA3058588.1 AAA family ATPase [Campylobacter sp. VBCF_05 NA6]